MWLSLARHWVGRTRAWLILTTLAFAEIAGTPHVRSAPVGVQPTLRGASAWAELERRGQRGPLLAALESARYDVRPVQETADTVGWENQAHALKATSTPEGVHLRAGESAMWLRPIGMGYADQLQPITQLAVRTASSRVEIDRASHVTEWWINRASGLEQGFTVHEAPGGRGSGAWLRVALAVDGDLTPEVAADGQSSTFVTTDGVVRLHYDHLLVQDATGRALPARMRAEADVLSLETDDTQAVYPVTIDPTFTDPTYLKASNTGSGDWFGFSLAVSGNTVVVGAPREDGNGTGVNPPSNDSAPDSGAAYVFLLSAGVWSPQGYLKASNTGSGDCFGQSVAALGDTIVVGAPCEDGGGTGVNPVSNEDASGAGAAYVFTRNGETWSQEAYLKSSNTGMFDEFGSSVAIDGNTLVVGASTESGGGTGVNPVSNEDAPGAGAAYVFVRSGSAWSQQAYLKASNTAAGDRFGGSVAASVNIVVVGARDEDGSGTGVNPSSDDSATNSGAAYVFVSNGTTWNQQAYVKASNTGATDSFGSSVAASGDTVVVGASGEDGSGTGVDPPSNEGATNSGAVYVFVFNEATWSQQSYLKASNTDAGDCFGCAVAVSGDRVLVGAPYEDTTGVGVNPAPNNGGGGTGAAYVFVRSGTTWTQHSFLKDMVYGVGNLDFWFGTSVAVSGGIVVVGEIGEDGTGTGVNPPLSYFANDSGAAFVFEATNAPPNDGFLNGQNAGRIGAPPYQSTVDTTEATTSSYDPVVTCGNGSRQRSVWYFYTPPANGPLTVNTIGSSYNTILSIYIGSPGGFTQLGCNDDSSGTQSSLTVQATQGQRLAILVTSYESSGGMLTLNAIGPPWPFSQISPAYISTTHTLSPTLSWSPSSGSASYEYCLDTSNDGACSAWTSVGANTSVVVSNLAPGVTYYWHVRAVNSGGTTYAGGVATAFWRFTTRLGSRLQVDFNGDARGDVFTYNPGTGDWVRQVSNGFGFAVQSQGAWAPGWSVAPALFDGDALTDMFLFNATTGAWAKVINDGTGFTTQSTGGWWPGWERYVMDLDSDGISDLFLYDPGTGTWFKCISTPGGFTYTQGAWNPEWELYPMSLNNDVLGDLFLINRTTGRWFWVLGQGGGSFTYPLTGAWFPGWSLYPGDFNGDGLTDLLLHDPPTGTYFVATNTGSGFSYTQGAWSLGWSPHVADFNADTREDLFLYDAVTGVWFEMLSDGAGNFTIAGGQRWSQGWKLYPVDVNRDGRTDMLLYDSGTGVWYDARNLINGSFIIYNSGTWLPGLTIITRTTIR